MKKLKLIELPTTWPAQIGDDDELPPGRYDRYRLDLLGLGRFEKVILLTKCGLKMLLSWEDVDD
jgi:hypothetical protein